MAHLPIGNLCQFHRTTANIADKAIRAGPAKQDTLRRQSGFFLAIDDVDFQPRFALDLRDEVAAIAGLTHGGGGDSGQAGQADAFGNGAKSS